MLEMQKRYDTEQKIIDAQKEISIEYLEKIIFFSSYQKNRKDDNFS